MLSMFLLHKPRRAMGNSANFHLMQVIPSLWTSLLISSKSSSQILLSRHHRWWRENETSFASLLIILILGTLLVSLSLFEPSASWEDIASQLPSHMAMDSEDHCQNVLFNFIQGDHIIKHFISHNPLLHDHCGNEPRGCLTSQIWHIDILFFAASVIFLNAKVEELDLQSCKHSKGYHMLPYVLAIAPPPIKENALLWKKDQVQGHRETLDSIWSLCKIASEVAQLLWLKGIDGSYKMR